MRSIPKLACLPWACSKSARKGLLSLPAVTLSGEDPAVQYKADAAPQHLQSQETAEGRWSLTLGSGFLVITAIQDQSLSSYIFPTLLISGCPLQICSFDAQVHF